MDDRNVIFGTEQADVIVGTDGRDNISGKGGNDLLQGALGNDTLKGGTGRDTLEGGADSDSLDGGIDGERDILRGGTGNDTYQIATESSGSVSNLIVDTIEELPNEGIDTVFAAVDQYNLGFNLENLYLIGLSRNGYGNELDNVIGVGTASTYNYHLQGNDGNDILIGSKGNDTLDGGFGNYRDNTGNNLDSGDDRMYGGAGDDTYYVDGVGDTVIEDINEGNDKVYAYVNHTLANNVEELYLKGTATIGNGNGLGNFIRGNDVNKDGIDIGNILKGFGGNDNLVGSIAGDTLDGGFGADKMSGAEGDDTYYVDNSSDDVDEKINQGTDRVYSSLYSYYLPDNVENLTLRQSANIGVGNELNNNIVGTNRSYSGENLNGRGGNDLLQGLAGGDRLLGGDGNDTLIGGAGNDRLTGGQGADDFRFTSLSERGDTITDFIWQQGDKIQIMPSFGASSTNQFSFNFNANTKSGILSYGSTPLATLTGLNRSSDFIVSIDLEIVS